MKQEAHFHYEFLLDMGNIKQLTMKSISLVKKNVANFRLSKKQGNKGKTHER